jgi:hypothetical protein
MKIQAIAFQTVIEEHDLIELIKTFGKYPNSHYAKRSKTFLDYKKLSYDFFKFLTRKKKA